MGSLASFIIRNMEVSMVTSELNDSNLVPRALFPGFMENRPGNEAGLILQQMKAFRCILAHGVTFHKRYSAA